LGEEKDFDMPMSHKLLKDVNLLFEVLLDKIKEAYCLLVDPEDDYYDLMKSSLEKMIEILDDYGVPFKSIKIVDEGLNDLRELGIIKIKNNRISLTKKGKETPVDLI